MKPNRDLMALLSRRGVMTMAEMAGNLGLSKAQVSRLCRDLVRRGWVERQSDPDDRRLSWFALTKAGRAEMKGGRDDRRGVYRLSGAAAD
jgi:DNA-binding MarR family transcriptional regulator